MAILGFVYNCIRNRKMMLLRVKFGIDQQFFLSEL